MNEYGMKRLAHQVVSRSLQLTAGQRVLIDVVGQAEIMVEALIEAVYEAKAVPFLEVIPIVHLRSIIGQCTEEQMTLWATHKRESIGQMDAYIGIRSDDNVYELQDLPADQYEQYVKGYLQPKQYAMASLGKWILLRNPTAALAQNARMSTSDFSQIYDAACNMDYQEWAKRAQPLANLLRRTDCVRIVSPSTDLSFSIKGMDAMICDGRYNLPDGEVFTAPLVHSADGVIAFNIATSYMGHEFNEIRLTFREGRVVAVEGPQKDRVESMLTQDEGSSLIGEFGIGLNPYIRSPMNNVLFDEKMHGSIHLALGQAYPMADNGNRSSLHWDMVLCQLETYGGGELFFDQMLVRKDGMFVVPELMGLNP